MAVEIAARHETITRDDVTDLIEHVGEFVVEQARRGRWRAIYVGDCDAICHTPMSETEVHELTFE